MITKECVKNMVSKKGLVEFMELLEKIKEYAAQYEKRSARDIRSVKRREKCQLCQEHYLTSMRSMENRLRYEAVYFKRREFLSAFGLASIIWHKKEDIQKA